MELPPSAHGIKPICSSLFSMHHIAANEPARLTPDIGRSYLIGYVIICHFPYLDIWILSLQIIGTSFMNPRPAMLDCPIINTLFIQHLHNFRFFHVKKDVPFCVIGNSRKFPITREIALSSQFTHYANCNPISHNLIISQLYYLRLSIYSQILSSNRQNGQRLPIH